MVERLRKDEVKEGKEEGSKSGSIEGGKVGR